MSFILAFLNYGPFPYRYRLINWTSLSTKSSTLLCLFCPRRWRSCSRKTNRRVAVGSGPRPARGSCGDNESHVAENRLSSRKNCKAVLVHELFSSYRQERRQRAVGAVCRHCFDMFSTKHFSLGTLGIYERLHNAAVAVVVGWTEIATLSKLGGGSRLAVRTRW